MKPVVLYEEVLWGPGPDGGPEVGGFVLLKNINHYNTDIVGRQVHTSTVVRVGENGEFETLNTIYRKKEA